MRRLPWAAMGVLLAVASSATGAAAETLKIGMLQAMNRIGIGIDRGFFARQGIDLEIVYFRSGSELVPSLARGQIDVAAPSVGAALFNLIATGLPVKMVADYAYNEPGVVAGSVIVRKDLIDSGAFKTPADAKGRTIGITARGQYSDFSAAAFLKLGNLTKSDVRFVDLSYPDMVTSLATKSIDIAMLPEPNATMAKEQGVGAMFMSNSDFIPDTNYTVIAYGENLTKTHHDLGLRFMRAYIDTVIDYNKLKGNPEGRKELAGMFQKHMPLADPTVYERVNLPSARPDPTIDRVHLAQQLAYFSDEGLIRKMPTLESVIDDSFVKEALTERTAEAGGK